MKATHSNILEDAELLSQFVARVFRSHDTPALIQVVAGDANYLLLTSAMVNAESEQDSALLRLLHTVCHHQGRNYSLFYEKLLPVARSLGLTSGSSNQLDYYAIVGVMPDASSEEIQKAYRKKAYEVHPDTSDSDKEDSQAFVRLHAAYQTLIDASLREQYDRSRQHRGIWYEHSPLNEVNPPIEKGRRDKTRHLYHLGAIVMVLIIAAFVFNSLYKHNSITDGFDSRLYNGTPSSYEGNVSPPHEGEKKLSVKLQPSTVSISANCGVAGVSNQIISHNNLTPVYHEGNTPDLLARDLSKDTSKENQMTTKDHTQNRKLVFQESEQQVVEKDTTTIQGTHQEMKAEMEKMEPTQRRKTKSSIPVKSTRGLSESMPSSPQGAIVYSENKEALPTKGESFLQSHGIPADSTPPPSYTAKEKKSIPIYDDKHQENIAFLASLSQDREGDEKQNPITQRDKTLDETPPTKNRGSTKVSRLEDKISQVKDFIQVYMNTYESKNIGEFTALFDPDAIENGKPFRDQIPNYRQNFQRLQAVTITIDMYQLNIRYASNMITTKGTFSLRWQAKGGTWHERKGDISMELIESGTSYLIKQIDYQYRSNQG